MGNKCYKNISDVKWLITSKINILYTHNICVYCIYLLFMYKYTEYIFQKNGFVILNIFIYYINKYM